MRTALKSALSIAVAVVLVALLLQWSGVSPATIARAIGALDARVYLAALALQAALYPLRAARLRQLLGERSPGLARLSSLSAAHILAANVLPAKIGEAALVVYLRRAGVAGARGAAVLVLTRLLDFAAVTGGLALACLSLAALGAGPGREWLLPVGLTLVLPAALCAWASARGERLVALARRALAALGLARTALGARALELAGRVGEALGEVPRGRLAAAAATTVPLWLGVFLFYALLARGFGIEDLSFPMAVFGAGLAIVATLLPLHGFAGFGVQDAGWVGGFTALGVGAELATSSGLAAHVVYLANLALYGALGHVAMGLWLKRAAVREP